MAHIANTSPNRIIKDLEERSMHLKKSCFNLKVRSGQLENRYLFIDKPHNLLYCKVPKCGSSYWLRFFQALNNKGYDPYNVFREKIHTTRMESFQFNVTDNINMNKTIRFLVTRSPYYRLYSAYVDKLFLPEFWYSVGRKIITHVRPNATRLAKLCGHDLTFVEFLKMIVHRDHERAMWNNEHWRPIEQLCNPCKYQYNYNIREETLIRDRDYLISKLGIRNQFILNSTTVSHVDYPLSFIKDMCHSLFIHFHIHKPKECYKIKDLLQRLFTTFQIQGYIREDALFDLVRFGETPKTNITRIIEVFQKIYREHPVLTRHDWEEQRKTFRKNAYQLVDTEILEGIKKRYDLDFKIFNYDTEPKEIFGNRKKTLNN